MSDQLPENPWTTSPFSEETRRDIVLGLLEGRYFYPRTDEEIRFSIGLILSGLSEKRKVTKKDLKKIGGIVGKPIPGGRYVNGYIPFCSSVWLIGNEDWKAITTAYNAELERRRRLKV